MKKRTIIAIIMIMSMAAGLMLSSCAKKPETLEAYVKSNKDVQEEINSMATDKSMKVEIKDNAITYTYDLADAEGSTEESIKDPAVQESLVSLLESSKDQFVNTCKELESTTGLSGITMTVTFTYEGEEIVTRTFSAAD